jgi:hypothetical protein
MLTPNSFLRGSDNTFGDGHGTGTHPIRVRVPRCAPGSLVAVAVRSSAVSLAVGTVLSVLVLLTVSGCGANTRVAPNGLQTKIASTQVYVSLRRREIGADIHRSSTASTVMGGGLIGAAIDADVNSGRSQKAEGDIVPIRTALYGYDISTAFSQPLWFQLSRESWLRSVRVEPRHLANETEIATSVAASPSEAVFVVDADYRMTPEFDGLRISANVSLYTHSPGSTTPSTGEPLPVRYYNELSTTLSLPSPSANQTVSSEEWVRRWVANGGGLLRQALDYGVAELARMITFDIRQPGTNSSARYYAAPTSKVTTAYVVASSGDEEENDVEGYVAYADGPRFWVRMPKGQLVSVGPLPYWAPPPAQPPVAQTVQPLPAPAAQ